MSVNNLIRTNSDEVAPWTNLFVNTLKVKDGIINPRISGNFNVYLNTDTGSDSNNGLTSSTAVATLTKAIAVLADFAYDTGIINLAGSATLVVGDEDNTTLENQLDFSALDGRYKRVKIQGTLPVNKQINDYASSTGSDRTSVISPITWRLIDGSDVILSSPKGLYDENLDKYYSLKSATASDSVVIGGIDIVQGHNLTFLDLPTVTLATPAAVNIINNINIDFIGLTIKNTLEGRFICNNLIKFAHCYLDPGSTTGVKGMLEGNPLIQGCEDVASANNVLIDNYTANIESYKNYSGSLTTSNTYGYSTIKDIETQAVSNDGIIVKGCLDVENINVLGDIGVTNANTNSYANVTIENMRVTGTVSGTKVPLHFVGPSAVTLKNYTSTATLGGTNPYNILLEDGAEMQLNGGIAQSNTLSRFANIKTNSKVNVAEDTTLNLGGSGVGGLWLVESNAHLSLNALAASDQYNPQSFTYPYIRLLTGATCYIADKRLPNLGTNSDLISIGIKNQGMGELRSQIDLTTNFQSDSMCKLIIGN